MGVEAGIRRGESMIRIGITGEAGFVGSSLSAHVSLHPDEFTVVPFDRSWFADGVALTRWVGQCDAIVHLAAVNRAEDQLALYEANVGLCVVLANAVRRAGTRPQIIFASSTQETRDNAYGRSKNAGRNVLATLASEMGLPFCGLIIPNVFGPFGRPHYNSVVATFCHEFCHGRTPRIDVDATLQLIYVDEVIDHILTAIRARTDQSSLALAATSESSVSDLLARFTSYSECYLAKAQIPELRTATDVNLFNTFRSFIDHRAHFPVALTAHVDPRGAFVELVRTGSSGQVSYSTTRPGITRGNHLHTRKVERFIVIGGQAVIRLRRYRSSEVVEFQLDGDAPAFVDMPIWYTHNITNVGRGELQTVFWINEAFDPANPDTYMEMV